MEPRDTLGSEQCATGTPCPGSKEADTNTDNWGRDLIFSCSQRCVELRTHGEQQLRKGPDQIDKILLLQSLMFRIVNLSETI